MASLRIFEGGLFCELELELEFKMKKVKFKI